MSRRTGRPRGWRDDAAWRQARAKKAGEAARLSHRRRALERVRGMEPDEAYRIGYRTGYNRAYHCWRAWALKTVAQLTGRRAAA